MSTALYPPEDYVVEECQADLLVMPNFMRLPDGALIIGDGKGCAVELALADVRRLARLLAAEVPQ